MQQVNPKAGDLVLVAATDDCLIAVGSYGVILGEVSRTKTPFTSWGNDKKRVDVLFNVSPMAWWDNGFVDSSGGPQRAIPVKDLHFTGKKKKHRFQYFPNGIMGADLAKTRKHTVNVFSVQL
jgi:hypothetical protein